jgi:hypothetical protein
MYHFEVKQDYTLDLYNFCGEYDEYNPDPNMNIGKVTFSLDQIICA